MLALKKKLAQYNKADLTRSQLIIDARVANQVWLANKPYINFCSNDYLNLATHPQVKQAFIDGAQTYGVGSSSSAFIAGYFKPQQILEEKFAAYMQRERAILFNSGYHANIGIMRVLATREHTIISDKLCHASILDGIQLARAKHYRYSHNNVQAAAHLLAKQSNPCLLVTESVFSMEGDIAPLNELALLRTQHDALLVVDDAHGIGVVENLGDGLQIYGKQVNANIDCLVTPLGKAVGSMGAFVSGKNDLIEAILQFSLSYIYTTALPPAIVISSAAALDVMFAENWRRATLQTLIHYFIQQATKYNITLGSNAITPIKTIIIGDNRKTLQLQQNLMQYGLLVSCIRPPTVPKGSARIRISLNCLHTETDIDLLLNRISDYLSHV